MKTRFPDLKEMLKELIEPLNQYLHPSHLPEEWNNEMGENNSITYKEVSNVDYQENDMSSSLVADAKSQVSPINIEEDRKSASEYDSKSQSPSMNTEEDRKSALDYDSKSQPSSPLFIAITRGKNEAAKEKRLRAIRLLRNYSRLTFSTEKNEWIQPLDSTFINTYLAYEKNNIVSKAAHTDMFTYLKKYTFDDVKAVVAQAVLSVFAYHSIGLVHLDIKSENFLITFLPERQKVELTDPDNVRSYQSKAVERKLTPGQLPPEICHHWLTSNLAIRQQLWHIKSKKKEYLSKLSITGKAILWSNLAESQRREFITLINNPKKLNKIILRSNEINKDVLKKTEIFWGEDFRYNIINSDKYIEADKKAIDCYALGLTLKQIKESIHFEDPLLDNMIERLLEKNPLKRLTIKEAIDHPYFNQKECTNKCENGCTIECEKQGREEYFNSIKKQYAKHPRTGGYHISLANLEENDSFYLLPDAIKEIYITTSTLNSQMNFMPDHFRNIPIENTGSTKKLCSEKDIYIEMSNINPLEDISDDKQTYIELSQPLDKTKKELDNEKQIIMDNELAFTIMRNTAMKLQRLTKTYLEIESYELINDLHQAASHIIEQIYILFNKHGKLDHLDKINCELLTPKKDSGLSEKSIFAKKKNIPDTSPSLLSVTQLGMRTSV